MCRPLINSKQPFVVTTKSGAIPPVGVKIVFGVGDYILALLWLVVGLWIPIMVRTPLAGMHCGLLEHLTRHGEAFRPGGAEKTPPFRR